MLGTARCVLAVAALGRFREEDQRSMYGTTPPTRSPSLPFRLAFLRSGAMSKGRQAHYVALLTKRALTMEEALSQALWAVSIQTGQSKGCSACLDRNTTGRANRARKTIRRKEKSTSKILRMSAVSSSFPATPLSLVPARVMFRNDSGIFKIQSKHSPIWLEHTSRTAQECLGIGFPPANILNYSTLCALSFHSTENDASCAYHDPGCRIHYRTGGEA